MKGKIKPLDIWENHNLFLVIDNVNAYTPGMIFTSLWSGVVTVNEFKNDLLFRSGNVQSAQVNQLVQSYGY